MEKSKIKYKVLIIDDEAQIRRLLRMTLETNEYKVFEASSAKEGMLAVTMNHPDVILLDLGLPDESGLSLLRQLREWSAVPVIVLTVQDSEWECQTGKCKSERATKLCYCCCFWRLFWGYASFP